MQHLTDAYENLSKTPEAVRYGSFDACLKSMHGFLYRDFVDFPSKHGYDIDENYRVSKSEHYDHVLCSQEFRGNDDFLQAWLFFGLLRCVVRKDEPILSHDSLIAERRRLSTSKLGDALEEWSEYFEALQSTSRNEFGMRCIEAVEILTLARRVVIANLAAENNHSHIVDDPRDQHSMCLMILGETLSATLAHIMTVYQIDIGGWQLDEDGWGPPTYVIKQMREEGWCLRFQEILRGQVGRSATLLYATLKCDASQDHTNGSHKACTADRCRFIEACHGVDGSGGKQPEYQPLHHPTCAGANDCQMVGPNEEDLLKILAQSEGRDGDFPLLRYHEEDSYAEVRVEMWAKGKAPEPQFATISHVWAHGLGNKLETKVRRCQLRYIRSLLSAVFDNDQSNSTQTSHLFWLDTLAMPVIGPHKQDDQRLQLRKKAIGSIYHIFNKAQHSIIIDRGLLKHNSVDDRTTIGIRLLSSAWMKRLWTLQEAFVSKSLSLAMRGGEVRQIDNLWEKDEKTDVGVMKDSLAASIQLKLSQNLMSDERNARITGAYEGTTSTPTFNEPDHRWSLLVASAWSSTRYRDVGRLDNETLALASLLNLPIADEEKSGEASTTLFKDKDEMKVRDGLMAKFWKAINEEKRLKYPIPAGIIFTPGERLSTPGFGWAPRTWMSGKDEAYPYPLSSPTYTTDLVDRGLMVHYPGFLIHAMDDKIRDILVPKSSGDTSFIFSTGAGLYDWYNVEPISGDVNASGLFVTELLARVKEKALPQLAIILSRPRPAEFPAEVALLVCIDPKEPKQKGAPHESRFRINARQRQYRKKTLYCRIIRRLQVSRISMLKHLGENLDDVVTNTTRVLDRYKRFDARVIGEVLNVDQKWCVDGYGEQDGDAAEFSDSEVYYSAQEFADEADDNTTSSGKTRKWTFKEMVDAATGYVANSVLGSQQDYVPEVESKKDGKQANSRARAFQMPAWLA